MSGTAPLRQGTRLSAERVTFRFDGRDYTGQRGDSAASALWAAGVRLLNRSIKYRRPRAFLALGPEEPNALVTVGAAPACVPNVPAPQLLVAAGLELRSQNRWPSLRHDLAATLLGLGSSFWGAGFYYKTFMWPSWRTYEPLIRKLAGLGYAPGASSLPAVPVRHLVADVLIAGGGPAGLVAALGAARAGLRVVLVEREPVLGGELEFEAATIDGEPALAWVSRIATSLEALGAVILTDTALTTVAESLAIAHQQPAGMPGNDTLYRVHAPLFVNAMGAVERGIAFVDNDRPGVMLVGAAERLLARYGVPAGRAVVLFGNHDRLYAAARRLRDAHVPVSAVVDTRTTTASALRPLLMADGVECLLGHTVTVARGSPELRTVTVAAIGAPTQTRRIPADALLVSGGWSPYVYAGLQSGGRPRYRDDLAAFTAEDQPEWRMACGAAAGHTDLVAVIADAQATGQKLAEHARHTGTDIAATPVVLDADAPPALVPYFRSPATPANEKRQFVDLQNDVTVADLRQALAEGFSDIEHVKRYTTLGVGTEQGRTGGTLGAAVLAELRGLPPAEVGLSRSRGPFQPVPMQALVGHRTAAELRPARRTALHELHVAAGGELELMGGWLRPRYYAANGPSAAAACIVEADRVRTAGGICDASTLGKIEIRGADAAAFIDRVYLGQPSSIAVGRSRYAVLLREDGMVLDDGLLLRVAADHFLATTSSSHLAHVLAHLEFHRDTDWVGRRVALTDVTEAWSVIVVAGPTSRTVLHDVLGTSGIAAIDRLSHMDVVDTTWGGYRVRVLRASFSGELAYEMHCQPAAAPLLWTRLAGSGLLPFGLEALDVLRVEKGYLTTSEITGQTTPQDLRMDRLVAAAPNAIGVALLDRPGLSDRERPILVGLHAADAGARFYGGAQLTEGADSVHSVGYVTSSVYSPALRRWVGLALIARRLTANGTALVARDPIREGDTTVTVVPTAHFDPHNERMKG